MRTKNYPLLALATLLLSAAQIQATTVIANFNTDLNVNGTTGTARPVVYSGGIAFQNDSADWAQNALPGVNTFTFSYDISSLGIGLADELLITVDTLGTNPNFSTASGHGIAVVDGNNSNWWDAADPGLSFSVVIEDASNNNINGDLSIDLTGIGIRWDTGSAGTFAGQNFSQTTELEGLNLTTGDTAETSFSGLMTGGTSFTQLKQLRFEIVPEPSSAALLGLAGMLTLLQRRRSA